MKLIQDVNVHFFSRVLCWTFLSCFNCWFHVFCGLCHYCFVSLSHL